VALDPDDNRTPSDAAEEEQEQRNRQLLELLNELRVAMPGVQVLFGFLLTVPFQARFEETTSAQRAIYTVTLVAAAVATACLIGPSALHRVTFRARQKDFVIQFGSWEFLVGLGALAVAMSGAVLLVLDFLYRGATPFVIVAALAIVYVTLWFVVGVYRRVRGKRDP
jgi:hypothetical protein